MVLDAAIAMRKRMADGPPNRTELFDLKHDAGGMVDVKLAERVADAYREFRRAQHAIRLTGAPHARVAPEAHAARRADVTALWVEVFGVAWNT